MLTSNDESSIIRLWLMNPGMEVEETYAHFPFLNIGRDAISPEELAVLYNNFNRRANRVTEPVEDPLGSNPFMEDINGDY